MKRKELKESLCRLIGSSTFHGVPQMIKTNYKMLKIIWMVFFVASASVCSYMVVKSIKQYFEFGVNTRYEIIAKTPMLFPSVTICNVNFLVTNYSIDFFENFLVETNSENGFYDSYMRLKNSTANESDINWMGGAKFLAMIRAFGRSLNDTDRKKLGYELETMMMDCWFDNRKCSKDDFEWFYDFNYGNCYRFNTGLRTPLKYTTMPGWRNGLDVYVFLGTEYNNLDYFLPDAKSNAAQVMVNDNLVMPNTYEGFQASAGTETFVRLEKTIINKLPSPYSDCQIENQSDDRKKNLNRDSYLYEFALGENITFKQIECVEICKIEEISLRCGCQFYDATFSKNRHLRLCDELSDTVCYSFQARNMSNEIIDKCRSVCPLECTSITFKTTMWTNTFPSEALQNSYKAAKIFEKLGKGDYLDTLEKSRQNLVRLRVFYDELSFTQVTDSASVEIFDLLSNVGGNLGLFLGISFLSFVELVEILVEISNFYFKYTSKIKTTIDS